MDNALKGFEILKAAIDSSSLPNSIANRENSVEKGGPGSGRKKGSKNKKKRNGPTKVAGGSLQKDYRNIQEA